MDNKIEQLENKISRIDQGIEDQLKNHLLYFFDQIFEFEVKIEKLIEKLEKKIEKKIEKINQKLRDFQDELDKIIELK